MMNAILPLVSLWLYAVPASPAATVAARLPIVLPGCPADSSAPYAQRWEFGDLTGWTDASQNMEGTVNYAASHDTLRIFTRKKTWDRPKIKTITSYAAGLYTWRVYTPPLGRGDMSSIGAFLYQDDTHELDFETGYGKEAVRTQLAAQDDDIIVYMTSQAFPFQSTPYKIKSAQWHTFSIRLDDHSGKYLASWYVDGNLAVQLPLGYGPEAQFAIYCSMENLKFLGDHIAHQENYALFDYVEYSQNQK